MFRFFIADICCEAISLQATRMVQSMILARTRVALIVLCTNFMPNNYKRVESSDRVHEFCFYVSLLSLLVLDTDYISV